YTANHIALFVAKYLCQVFATFGRPDMLSTGAGATGHRTTAQHAQYGFGGTLTQGTMGFGAAQVAPGNLVDGLDQNRETDGRVQIPFRHYKTKAFGQEREADRSEERRVGKERRWRRAATI